MFSGENFTGHIFNLACFYKWWNTL